MAADGAGDAGVPRLDGKFSKAVFDAALRNNGFTEARFLAQLRADISQRQLLSAAQRRRSPRRMPR